MMEYIMSTLCWKDADSGNPNPNPNPTHEQFSHTMATLTCDAKHDSTWIFAKTNVDVEPITVGVRQETHWFQTTLRTIYLKGNEVYPAVDNK